MGLPLASSLTALAACSAKGPPPLTELGELPVNKIASAWQVSMDDAGVGFVPAVAASKIWATDKSGDVVALEPLSGKRQTRFEVDRPLTSGVGVEGDFLVVVDTDGVLLAFGTDGKLRWEAALEAEPLSLPTVRFGQVLLRLSNSTVVSYDLETGKRRWLFAQKNPALVLRQNAGIAVDTSTAYVGVAGGRVAALSLSTGAVRWESRISVPRGSNEIERISDILGMPMVTGPTVCAAAYQGRLTCVNSSNGQAVWSFDMKAASGLALDAQVMVVTDTDGRLHAFSRSQQTLWTQDALRGRRLAAPALIDGKVWVGDAGGVIHALDALDGRLIGRVETDESPIVSAPQAVRAEGKTHVVVQTTEGTVVAVAAL